MTPAHTNRPRHRVSPTGIESPARTRFYAHREWWGALRLLLTAATFACCAWSANAQSDPPLRAGSLSAIDGSAVFAPTGQTDWSDAVLNQPVTTGDRLWTDLGGRAEVHLGSCVLHMDSEVYVEISHLDEDVFQASLNRGSVNLRVRRLAEGENVEIDTAQLALRVTRPGDYRIDVDPVRHTTGVTVRSGVALVFGSDGRPVQLKTGPRYSFAGRNLEPGPGAAADDNDDFARWAGDRNRRADSSPAAHHLPLDVVGYSQLDTHGNWSQDPTYGAVWSPRAVPTDWAPYRYGRWEWIAPWGWSWIDDAPWGFAPFHYGRWTQINSRWAWVPGRMDSQPVYSPALVAFVGAATGNLPVGSDAIVGWFPLAPGEAWRPNFRSSVAYLRNVNRYIAGTNITSGIHVYQDRPETITAARLDDFMGARPLRSRWRQLRAADLARVRLIVPPAPPEPVR